MKRGCGYVFLVFLVLMGVGAWNFFVSVPLEISPETTVVTEPRTADGRNIDFFALMRADYPAEMKTEKNAACEILRRLGPGENLYRDLRTVHDGGFYDSGRDATEAETVAKYKEYYETLGLEPVVPDAKAETPFTPLSRTLFYTWLEAKYPNRFDDDAQYDEYEARANRFHDADLDGYFSIEPEFVREWLTQNSPALDAVAEAVKKAEFCKFPYVFPVRKNATPLAVLLPGAGDVGEIQNGFFVRISVSVAEGRFDDALADYETCVKLGRQIMQESDMLVELFVGYSFENTIRNQKFFTNPDFQPTAEQWRRIREFPQSVPWTEIKEVLKKERLSDIACIQSASLYPRENEYIFPDNSPVKYLAYLGYDWNHVARRFNEFYTYCFCQDEYHSPSVFEEPYKDYNTEWDFIPLLLTRKSRSELLAVVLNRIFNQSIHGSTFWLFENNHSAADLYRLGIAMQLYRLEHDGKLPPAFSVDAEEKPLHSWRVLILPYIGLKECDELYAKIRLDEPWDSEWNRQFHAEMPDIFQCMTLETPDIYRSSIRKEKPTGETNYTVILGENRLFDGTGTGRDYVQMIRDEPTRKVGEMALIVERTDSVPWMRPDAEWTREGLQKMIASKQANMNGDVAYVSCSGAVGCG
ncbi:MAG: hypothetical protein Q4C70_03190, partial [Planctomycetia bacterium]|nr:hypothetical protein [Planctomycetia bacterium]